VRLDFHFRNWKEKSNFVNPDFVAQGVSKTLNFGGDFSTKMGAKTVFSDASKTALGSMVVVNVPCYSGTFTILTMKQHRSFHRGRGKVCRSLWVRCRIQKEQRAPVPLVANGKFLDSRCSERTTF